MIEGRRRDAPFFLYLSFAEPHGTIASPDRFNAQHAAHAWLAAPDPVPNAGRVPDNLAARGPARTAQTSGHLDYQVGRLLGASTARFARVDARALYQRQRSGHGTGAIGGERSTAWQPGDLRGRKEDLYDGGIRVPAIVRVPGRLPAGRTVDEPVHSYDVMPTIAAIVGAPLPADRPIDGENVSALLRGEAFRRARPLYWEFDDPNGFSFALRDGRWKLLVDRALTRVRLFDLSADRFEVVDRAGDEPEVVGRLLDELRRRRDEVETIHQAARSGSQGWRPIARSSRCGAPHAGSADRRPRLSLDILVRGRHAPLACPVETRTSSCYRGHARSHHPAPCPRWGRFIPTRSRPVRAGVGPSAVAQAGHAVSGARAHGAEWIKGAWGTTESAREAKFYSLTRAGERALAEQAERRRRLAGLSTSSCSRTERMRHTILRLFLRLLSSLRRSSRAERELAREIRSHLRLLEDQHIADGMNAEEARYAALRAFGGVEQVKEHQRETRMFRWLAGWPMDLRLGGRMLVKYPGLTIVGGMAMAFAIWVGIVIFQVVGLFVHPTLPLPQGARLVEIRSMDVAENVQEERSSTTSSSGGSRCDRSPRSAHGAIRAET